MTNEDSYEPLAEIIYNSGNNFDDEVYLLCSRSILWNPSAWKSLRNEIDEDNITVEEDCCVEQDVNPSLVEEGALKFFTSTESPTHVTLLSKKKDQHEEPTSCYCSASHYSTDEHDSLKESGTSHHSDSGADLSESSRDADWEKYWATNGERLIWESWISKYGDYIDPNYMNQNDNELQNYNDETSYLISFENENKNDAKRISFSGLLDEINTNTIESEDCKDVKNVDETIQDELNCIQKEPLNVEKCLNESCDIIVGRSSDTSESDGSSNRSGSFSNNEEIRLSSGSRCSRNSLALTATTDSMTNVTKMTLSSSDSVTDESSARSNSFVSSNSQSEADHQWQLLWSDHFNEQYYSHYREFVKYKSSVDDGCSHNYDIDPSNAIVDNGTQTNINTDKFEIDQDFHNSIDKSDIDSSEQVTCILKYDDEHMDSSSDCPDVGALNLDEPVTKEDLKENKSVKKRLSKKKNINYNSVSYSLNYLRNDLDAVSDNLNSFENSNADDTSTKKDQPVYFEKIVDNDNVDISMDVEPFDNGAYKQIVNSDSEVVEPVSTNFSNDNMTSEITQINNFNIDSDIASKCVNACDISESETVLSGAEGFKTNTDEPSDVNFKILTSIERDLANSINANNRRQDRIKNALYLMGFSYNFKNADGQPVNCKSSVIYKKKNIKSQNRMLKMNINLNRFNKHIRFDDDGEEIPSTSNLNGEEQIQDDQVNKLDQAILNEEEDDEDLPAENEEIVKPDIKEKSDELASSNDLNSFQSSSHCITTSNSCKRTSKTEMEEFSEKDDSTDADDFSEEKTELDCSVDRKEAGRCKPPHRKKKRKQAKKKTYSFDLMEQLPAEILNDLSLVKYWYQRYRLFLKFDEGIKLDAESWYSVTPEKVSKHIAERCCCDLVIDAFCGAGGNTIQLAFTCERVIGIDIDPVKIELAKNNAAVYGVEDRIEFIVGDFFKLAPTLKADVIFLSPPWGGPQYTSKPSYSLDNILEPTGGHQLYDIARNITENIAYFLPKNTNTHELISIGGPGSEVEIEQNFLDKKLISLTAYFGELIKYPD